MLTAESVKTLGKALVAARELNKSEECLRLLKDLENGVKPTTALLKETKIGATVNDLARKGAADEAVTKEAKRLVARWRSVVSASQKDNGQSVKKKSTKSAPSTTPRVPDATVKPSSTPEKVVEGQSAPAEGVKRATAKDTTVGRRRKRSPSPPPPVGKSDAPGPDKQRRKTAHEVVDKEPESRSKKDKAPPPPHVRDEVDFAARLTDSALDCPRKVFTMRVRCCESLYDALASGSDATSGSLAACTVAVENAAWDKAVKDKGEEGALGLYTPHVRSLYQHLRSAKTPSLREDLLGGQMSAQQLVDMSPADFRTSEQKALDEAVRQQAMKEACFSAMSVAEDMRQTVIWRCGGR
ncbi:hypothetical protein JCM3774_000332 [Rhodotorula dairenensis]